MTISWPSLLCRGLDASTIQQPGANLEEGRAWLRLNEEPVREGAIKITRAGSGPGAGLIDFDGIGSVRELR